MTRYYIHGDENEENLSTYYCAICDDFTLTDHFDSHESRNRERYDLSVARLKNLKNPLTRPKNSPSLSEQWPKPIKPLRSPFYRWLMKQSDRDDPIGDFAVDVSRDRDFPSNSQSLKELVQHISSKRACSEAITALREAFSEHRSKGKPRSGISLKLRFAIFHECDYCCQICGRKASPELALEIDHKTPVAKGGTDDPDNLWVLCFDCNRGKGASKL